MLDVSQRQSLGAASGVSSLRCACLNSCSYHGTVFNKRSSTVYHHGIGVCTSVSPTRSNVSLACALWPQTEDRQHNCNPQSQG